MYRYISQITIKCLFLIFQRDMPNISKIAERLDSNTKKLLTCREEIISPYDIPTLKEKISDEEKKLKEYQDKWFQCMLIRCHWVFFFK